MLLDQDDTQRGNLKSNRLMLGLNIQISFFVFIAFNTCKARFDIAIRSLSKRSSNACFRDIGCVSTVAN